MRLDIGGVVANVSLMVSPSFTTFWLRARNREKSIGHLESMQKVSTFHPYITEVVLEA